METWVKEKLLKDIGEKRYRHCIGVMETSKELAINYNCNVQKAMIAGLLHDCGKFTDPIYSLKRINDFGIILDNVSALNSELIHGQLGAKVAETEYMIDDIEILDAIYFHTTGREGMTLLEKIIYIADYIEPNRSYLGIEDLRILAFKDIDKCILLIMEQTLSYLIKNKKLIHNDTINAWNFFMLNVKLE